MKNTRGRKTMKSVPSNLVLCLSFALLAGCTTTQWGTLICIEPDPQTTAVPSNSMLEQFRACTGVQTKPEHFSSYTNEYGRCEAWVYFETKRDGHRALRALKHSDTLRVRSVGTVDQAYLHEFAAFSQRKPPAPEGM